MFSRSDPFLALLKLLVAVAIAAGPFSVAHAMGGHASSGAGLHVAAAVAHEHSGAQHHMQKAADCAAGKHHKASRDDGMLDSNCCVGHCDTAMAASFDAAGLEPAAADLFLPVATVANPGAQVLLQRPPRT